MRRAMRIALRRTDAPSYADSMRRSDATYGRTYGLTKNLSHL